MTKAGRRPALATTYEGQDPALLERILPLVDYIEISPDSLAVADGERVSLPNPALEELQRISEDVRIVVHGVGLSIGSHEGYSEQYLRLLDKLVEHIPLAWHSEHLGYTRVDGEFLGTMLALPKSHEVLDMVCERVHRIQDRYDLPFSLENIIHLLPDCDADYSDAEFLNELTRRTGCGLLLDVYNLECDAYNHGLKVSQFLEELDMQSVTEIHLAGGVVHRGFMLDVHSGLTSDTTISLAREVLTRAPRVRAVTYEFMREAVPILGHDAIADELERLARALCS